ncbi:hypothetical protein [Burkholderia plantarii]|uniref:hypothetical protein n=1 Tax=Burkholderia plantarii TaxID=41899 RepID=UPI0006D8CEAC|nr:hypothetical protein [Burkholderia plantarii]GLZ18625.1 hypothetical protein Bpla01_21550 [Burkholderia plantarii]
MKSGKQFLAGVLGTVIAARHAGVGCEKIVVTIDPYDHSLKLENPDFMDWVGLIRQRDPDAYLRKRLLVLCARAWAEALVVQRDAVAQGRTPSPDQFWQCLGHGSDDSIAHEVAIVHLTRNRIAGCQGAEACSDEAFADKVNKVILEFGLKPLSALITEDAFLRFLDDFCHTRLDPDGRLPNGRVDFDDGVAAGYQPGVNEVRFDDVKSVPVRVDDSEVASGEDVLGGKGDDDVKCLFAHELGHWIAACKLGIRTSAIELAWSCRWDAKTEPDGHCTIHLDSVAGAWDDLRYLEARIAVLAAGALADYCFRHPGEVAVGDGFYKLLSNGTGRDDFRKMRELLVLYVAIKFRDDTYMMSRFSWPLNGQVVLNAVVPLMKQDLKIWDLIRSDDFRAFVTEIIDTERSKLAVGFVEDSKVRIRMRTARVEAVLARHHDLHKLVQPPCSAPTPPDACDTDAAAGDKPRLSR